MKKLALLAAVATAVGVALYLFDRARSARAPTWPFKLLTGWDWPGCGFQRFLHALLHGRLREAIRYNFFLLYALPYTLCLAGVWLMPAGATKRKVARVVESPWLVWTYIVSFGVWLVVRNLLHI
jgi:hypothetical protein